MNYICQEHFQHLHILLHMCIDFNITLVGFSE
jgi:hypothetical protein